MPQLRSQTKFMITCWLNKKYNIFESIFYNHLHSGLYDMTREVFWQYPREGCPWVLPICLKNCLFLQYFLSYFGFVSVSVSTYLTAGLEWINTNTSSSSTSRGRRRRRRGEGGEWGKVMMSDSRGRWGKILGRLAIVFGWRPFCSSVLSVMKKLSIFASVYQFFLFFSILFLLWDFGRWRRQLANLLFEFFSHFSSSFFCGRRHGLQICRGQF